VNQIRKKFMEQKQQNFLKRVVRNDPRTHQQLRDLVQNDEYILQNGQENEESNGRCSVDSNSTINSHLKYKGLIDYNSREMIKKSSLVQLDDKCSKKSRRSPKKAKKPTSYMVREIGPEEDFAEEAEIEPQKALEEIDRFETRMGDAASLASRWLSGSNASGC
jgi:hypothetical protein